MTKNYLKFSYLLLISIILSVGISISLQSILAWTAPLNTPPTCNSGDPGCDPPINESATTQTKNGALNVLGDMGVGSALTVVDYATIGGDFSVVSNHLFVKKTGNNYVGIGDTTPDAVLDISSTADTTLFRVDDNGEGDASPFIIDKDGNVGIGIDSTKAKLTIANNIRLIPTDFPDTCDGELRGAIYYDSSDDKFKGCTSSGWEVLN